MVACGPFTVSNELSFEALKDLMAIVNRDMPHVLILSGPFVSCGHEDVMSGDLRYRDL
jgi:DNA polymerase alpha subunit B